MDRGKEARALASIATMRDKLVVFNGVREIIETPDMDPTERYRKIRDYYEAFDADHPAT